MAGEVLAEETINRRGTAGAMPVEETMDVRDPQWERHWRERHQRKGQTTGEASPGETPMEETIDRRGASESNTSRREMMLVPHLQGRMKCVPGQN